MSKSRLWYCIPYLALVAFHAALSLKVRFPSVVPDEFSFLVTARYFAGSGIIPDLTGQYLRPSLYPALIAPFLWIFTDPLQAYKAVLLFNASLLSTIYFSLLVLIHRILKAPLKLAAAIAFVTALYPAFIINAQFALSENLFIPLYTGAIITFWRLCIRGNIRWVLLFGLIVPLLYAAHGKAFPVIILSFLHLIILMFIRRLSLWTGGLGCSCLLGGYFMVEWINEHVAFAVGAIRHSVTDLFVTLSTLSGWWEFFIEALGQTWYLTVATYGLFLFGIFFLIRTLWKAGQQTALGCFRNSESHTLLFLLTTSTGMFFTANLHLAGRILIIPEWVNFIYGRYNEGFIAVFIAIALLGLYTEMKPRSWRKVLLVPLIIVAITALLYAIRGVQVFPAVHDPGSSLFGLGPWYLYGTTSLSFAVGTLVVCGIWFTLALSTKRAYAMGLILVSMAFVLSTAHAYRRILSKGHYLARHFQIAASIRELGPYAAHINFDVDAPSVYPGRTAFITGLHFLLPESKIHLFSMSQNLIPTTPLIISGTQWPEGQHRGARFLTAVYGANRALWFLPVPSTP